MVCCGYCNERKGKRHCPALEKTICALCCGENRLVHIPCPDDCPHLQAGESYQRERRMERAAASGRDYLQERMRILRDRRALNGVAMLERAVHILRRTGDALRDDAVVRALDQLPLHLGTLEVVVSAPDPLAVALAKKIKQEKHFDDFRALPQEDRDRLIRTIRDHAARLSERQPHGTRYLDFIATYFDAIVSERELHQERAGPDAEEPEERGYSPGGIIIP